MFFYDNKVNESQQPMLEKLNETSHEALYQDLLTVFNETQDMQRELYNLMFKKGWYSLEAADAQKMQQTYQQFSDYMNQFPHKSPAQ